MSCERGLPQRVSYQRSIVSAQVGIALSVVFLALQAWKQSPETITIPTQRILTLEELYFPDESKMVDGPYPLARSNIPPEERRTGFLGFVNLSPQDDRRVPETLLPIQSDVYITAPEALFDDERALSFSLEMGVLDTVVLPRATVARRTEPAAERVNRPPCVVKKFDPPYPSAYLMSDSLIEGLVTLEVSIDDRGAMVRFVPVLPDGRSLDAAWYFARAELVRKVTVDSSGTRRFGPWRVDSATCFAQSVGWMLKFWTFGPALCDGRPVSGDLIITYYFCLDYPDCVELTLDDVVRDIAYSFHEEE